MGGKYLVEITDTLGGEANYSWVRRFSVAGTRRDAIRRASAHMGYQGRLVKTMDDGDEVIHRIRGACIQMTTRSYTEFDDWLCHVEPLV